MIDRSHDLSLVRQAELLKLSRSDSTTNLKPFRRPIL